MRHIIPISGKDSLATALFQTAWDDTLPYEYMFNPTGSELPENWEWLERVEKHLDKPINFVGENLEDIIEFNGYFLPSRLARYCTRQSKIEPMEKWLGKDDATIYFGIRADEDRTGYISIANPNLITSYPLKDHNINLQGVYLIINKAGLKPPTFFWESVYKEVVKRIPESVIKSLLTEWQIDMLFAGRTRNNCFFCFNQRQYEWVWLLETHPELFDKAEWYETQGSEKKYSWGAKPLSDIRLEANRIKEKHIDKICQFIIGLTQMKIPFGDEVLSDKGELDILSVKSCGLLCGK